MAAQVIAFRILGPLQVFVEGASIGIGPRQSLVLATLLLHANQPVPIERLVEAAWERPPASARSNVRTHVAALRRVLGPARLRQARGYILSLASSELDAAIFTDCLARGSAAVRDGDCQNATCWLSKALRQWRSHPLEGLPLTPRLRLEVSRLDELRLVAASRYIEARLLSDDLAGLPEFIRPWLGEQPYREDIWAQLMVTLYRSGRVAEALDAFSQARKLLREDVGLDPGRQLSQLQERILAADPLL